MFEPTTQVILKTNKNYAQFKIHVKRLECFYIRSHTRWRIFAMLMKASKWIYVLAYIDLVVCFACDSVNVVLMGYWRHYFFIFGIVVFNVILFILEIRVSNVEPFEVLVFFVFSMFWKSYLTCSLVRLDYINVSLMSNYNRNHTV